MAVIEVPDPSVVVLIGAAGSGKSTFAARHFAPDEILSSDALRARISGDAADQRASGMVFRILERSLDGRFAAARRHGHPAVAIVLALRRDVVHARNGARERVVAADVVDRHLRAIEATGDAERLRLEGFASVAVLTTPEAVDAAVVRRRPA